MSAELPINIEFAAAYLDGVMESEQLEIARQWRIIREHLAIDHRAAVINSPETADFMAGVPLEAAHQRERWGSDHDAGKTPFDWFWLIGYLAQKAAAAAIARDFEKARHHTISTAAALANWHAQLSGRSSAMRPGIEPPASIEAATA